MRLKVKKKNTDCLHKAKTFKLWVFVKLYKKKQKKKQMVLLTAVIRGNSVQFYIWPNCQKKPSLLQYVVVPQLIA